MKKGQVIFGVLVAAVAVVGGIIIYRRLRKPTTGEVTGGSTTSTGSAPTGSASTSTGTQPSGFPLSYGSKGQLVKDIQKALMILYPNSLPKYGADGVWGKETDSALKSHNLPTVINKPDYDRIIAASKSGQMPSTPPQSGVAGWFV